MNVGVSAFYIGWKHEAGYPPYVKVSKEVLKNRHSSSLIANSGCRQMSGGVDEGIKISVW